MYKTSVLARRSTNKMDEDKDSGVTNENGACQDEDDNEDTSPAALLSEPSSSSPSSRPEEKPKESSAPLLVADNAVAETARRQLQLDDALSSLKFGLYQIQMLALVGGGYFAVCAEFMLFVFLSSPAKAEWSLADYEFPWLPFSSGVAGIVGGFLFGTVSDRFGRRVPFIVGMTFVAVFGLASAFANSFPLFVAFRCVVIFGTAAFKCVGFVLLLEFLPKERRGTVMVVVTICGALGAVLVAALAWGLLESVGWRWFVGTCAVPAWLVLVMAVCMLQETPRFLFTSGQKAKGMKVLRLMAERNNAVAFVDGEIVHPQDNAAAPRGRGRPLGRGNLRQLFRGDLLPRTVALSLVWLLQSTGYWGVTTYLPEYLTSLGVHPYLNMFSVFIGELPGLALAMVLIERRSLGRVNCLRAFSALTFLSLLAFAFVPLHQLKTFFAVMVFFGMVPIYSVLNTITPEVYPTSVRSTAMGWVNVVMEVPALVTPFAGEFLLSCRSIPWLYPVVWAAVFALQLGVTVIGLSWREETAGENLVDGGGGGDDGGGG